MSLLVSEERNGILRNPDTVPTKFPLGCPSSFRLPKCLLFSFIKICNTIEGLKLRKNIGPSGPPPLFPFVKLQVTQAHC